MNKIWKKLTALALCAAMLSGCGSGAAAAPAGKEAEAGEAFCLFGESRAHREAQAPHAPHMRWSYV